MYYNMNGCKHNFLVVTYTAIKRLQRAELDARRVIVAASRLLHHSTKITLQVHVRPARCSVASERDWKEEGTRRREHAPRYLARTIQILCAV